MRWQSDLWKGGCTKSERGARTKRARDCEMSSDMEAEAEKRRCRVNSDDTAGKGKTCHLLLKHCCSLSIPNPFFPPPPQPLSQVVSTISEEYISCLCDHVWLYEYLLMSFSMLSIYLTAFLAVHHAASGSQNACQSCTFSIMMIKLTRETCITQLKWQETRLIKDPPPTDTLIPPPPSSLHVCQSWSNGRKYNFQIAVTTFQHTQVTTDKIAFEGHVSWRWEDMCSIQCAHDLFNCNKGWITATGSMHVLLCDGTTGVNFVREVIK